MFTLHNRFQFNILMQHVKSCDTNKYNEALYLDSYSLGRFGLTLPFEFY